MHGHRALLVAAVTTTLNQHARIRAKLAPVQARIRRFYRASHAEHLSRRIPLNHAENGLAEPIIISPLLGAILGPVGFQDRCIQLSATLPRDDSKG